MKNTFFTKPHYDQVKDPKKNYKFGVGLVPCNHDCTSDFSFGMHTDDPIPHTYCHSCGWHKYRGVEYTRDEWKAMINSPNPEDPEYEKLLEPAPEKPI